jgi:uncharacterized protein (DUF2147 family)
LLFLARLAACLLMACAPLALAQTSPSGLWRSIDDATAKPQALVRIVIENGEASGRIEKLFPNASEDPNPLCAKCEGTRKNRPVLGMTILWGLKPYGEEYAGGEIIDPENGSIYRASIVTVEGGRKLRVRGYLGMVLFGRTQVWERVE